MAKLNFGFAFVSFEVKIRFVA